MSFRTRAIALCFAVAASAAFAAPSFSKEGDPARWYQPLENQKATYDNAMTEARNALAEALRECRTDAQRKACEARARAQYQKDVAQAREVLAPTRQPG